MTNRLIVADVLDGLAQIESGSVQCCVTSPPYWGLRDYGTAKWDGGDAECDHARDVSSANRSSTLEGSRDTQTAAHIAAATYRGDCRKCGARQIDAQIGLEPTPEAYVAKLVGVFDEVRRVLRDDGTLWLNLGDSYAAQRGGTAMPAETLAGGTGGIGPENSHRGRGSNFQSHRDARGIGLKHKDLVGIPWRVAFALQRAGAASPETMDRVGRLIAAITGSYETRDEWPDKIRSTVESMEREFSDAQRGGWYLRSDIIWSKPNPMPESVTDRPTKAHEYVFLLSKSARYFYDAKAIAEDGTESSSERARYGWNGKMVFQPDGKELRSQPDRVDRMGERWCPAKRNARTVWTIATEPFPEAHFATFPRELPRRCIKAGSRKGDTVLDPFAGSGTVGLICAELNRNFIGIELSPKYAEMADRRINGTLFARISR